MQFWPPDDEHMVLETCRGMKYTEMQHGQQNVKKK